MAGRTYSEHVVVLRKTKLREADLVLTMLAEDGRQVRAVAKGALKPAGTFASRLELYSEASVLLVEGRSLDIVKEARLVDGHAPLRFDYERSVHAAPVVELLSHATQDQLPVERLFPMTQAALSALERFGGLRVPLAMCAFLLKAAALLGFRPSLVQCAECGEYRAPGTPAAFSFSAGGVLCPDCTPYQETVQVPVGVIDWADALLHATFDQVGEMGIDAGTLRELIRFTQTWVEVHLASLRSLRFLLSDALA